MFMSKVKFSGQILENAAEYSRGGTNLQAYVGADPINFTEPLGLVECGAGEVPVFQEVTPRNPEPDVVYAPGRYFCVRLNSEQGRSAGIDMGDILGGIGRVLDDFAEDHLKPPLPRQPGETTEQCEARIAGATPALAISGASGIAAGGAFLGYSRTPIAGGGGGTSLISSASRGSFGKAKFSGGLGTGSVGGFIGRLASKVSVVVGAAQVGLAVGIGVGAQERCK